ncbi:hypothetical protein H072_1195 [Dactylellina haptotyla CBS 200.50]|uniref:Amine oxidase domain-containing protein n=1 Tax=Dactylellina haptotyla (strain CBS 200.50) TaxID=1284197 RepID=S8BZL0_DACHA|nr:hypothetical protein H072_1195 [Dactylellina haptotyla CBS 200.50]
MTIAETALSNEEQLKKPKIIVVGAGTCGLRAAEVLIRAGCDVQVLEARDRIGGRIATSSKLGLPLDLGANWIHGDQGNPIIAIAEKAGSSYTAEELDDTVVYAPDGTLLSKRLGEELVTRMWNYFEDGIEHSEQNFATIKPNISFGEYYRARINEECEDKTIKVYQTEVMEIMGAIVAMGIQKQDLKNLYLEKPIPGGDVFLSSTYGPVMELMAKTVRENGCLQLSTPVERVETVHTASGPLHGVHTKDGNIHKADGVLVTIPLGALKQDRVTFNPPIPEQIRQSIKHLGYGSLEKTYISFPTAFWADGPSYFVFLAPEYAVTTNTERKPLTAISLAHLPALHNQPTLLFYTHSDISKYITDILQTETPAFARDKILAFFEPYYSRLPNYSSEDPACVPVDFISTNWLNDEYAGNGSYTNFPVGLVDGAEDIKVIREGVPGQRLWFCGEHTAPLLGLASVSGAYWAGEGTARKCLVEFGMMDEEEERALRVEDLI